MSATLASMDGKEPADWAPEQLSALVAEFTGASCDAVAKHAIAKAIGDLAAVETHRERLFGEKALLGALHSMLDASADTPAKALAARAVGNLSYDHEGSARAAIALGIHRSLVAALSSALDAYDAAGDEQRAQLGQVLRNCSGALANFASAGLDVQEQLLEAGALLQFVRVLECGAQHLVALIMAARGVSNLLDGEGAERVTTKHVGASVVRALDKVFSRTVAEQGDDADPMLPHALSVLEGALRSCAGDAALAAAMISADGVIPCLLSLLQQCEERGRPHYVKPSADRPAAGDSDDEDVDEDVALNKALWDVFDAAVAHESCIPLFAPHVAGVLDAAEDLARFDHDRATTFAAALTASDKNIAALMEHRARLSSMLDAEPLGGQAKLLALLTNLASTESNCRVLVDDGVFKKIAERMISCDVPPKTDMDDSSPSVVVGRMYVASTSEELDRFRVLYSALTAVRNFAIAPFCKELIAKDEQLVKRIIHLTQYENPHLRWVAVCLLRSLSASEANIAPLKQAGAVSAMAALSQAQLPEGQLKINLEAARCVFGLAYGPFSGHDDERRAVAKESGLQPFQLLLQSEHVLLQSEALKMFMLLTRDGDAASEFAKDVREDSKTLARLIALIGSGLKGIDLLSVNVISNVVKSTGPLPEAVRADLVQNLGKVQQDENFRGVAEQLVSAHSSSS